MNYSERLFRRVRVWLPAVVVSVFFLFHVETTGLLSHLTHKDSVATSRYRITIPPHWIVGYASEEGDWFNISAVEGYGVFRGWRFGQWRWWRAPYASVVGVAYPRSRQDMEQHRAAWLNWAQVVATSRKPIRGGAMDCTEYVRKTRDGATSSADRRFIWVECTVQTKAAAPGLGVAFVGAPELLPDFDDFLWTRVEAK